MVLRRVLRGRQGEVFSNQGQLFGKKAEEEENQTGDKEKQRTDRNPFAAQQNGNAPHRAEQQEKDCRREKQAHRVKHRCDMNYLKDGIKSCFDADGRCAG